MAETPREQGNCDLDLGGSFLKDLPPSIPRYTYTGESQFLDILQSEYARLRSSNTASEFLLFHASKDTIKSIFNPQNGDTSLARNFNSFDTTEQLLLAKMSLDPHGVAAHFMNIAMYNVFNTMGLGNIIHGHPGVKFEGNDRGKVADYSWGPVRGPRDGPRSPSVALEVAYSETDVKLNSDVRFWLDPDSSQANICLTLRINRSRPEIRIEKWERRNNRAHRSQIIWITRKGDQSNVSHHPLVIPFEGLLRRQSSCPGEKDLEISQGELKKVAEAIWKAQEL
ncbi:uncharacterized protein N7458_008028 [Penicillium daleae]|uniref:Uncharacterized protein n=1 Tax=Penicillium daleae TaxID=63821 RepID=A0AAD6C3I4_9EURO|nr:uncharacterized protein N7458_008028 [Penicillium daleae]KAJ5444156.1 hypothetical protein N7458_008028 [Penicillium daleae]